MRLPNHANAIVPKAKITDYLLSPVHRDGRSKALFFTRFGFSIKNWQTLAEAMLQHAAEHELAATEASPFGTRYVIDGIIRTPDGRMPTIRTVWFIEKDEQVPTFVTAYPLRGRKK